MQKSNCLQKSKRVTDISFISVINNTIVNFLFEQSKEIFRYVFGRRSLIYPVAKSLFYWFILKVFDIQMVNSLFVYETVG